MNNDYESMWNDAQFYIRKLENEISNLKDDNKKLYDKLDSARFRISEELEPRIEKEKQAYDRWVSDPEIRGAR